MYKSSSDFDSEDWIELVNPSEDTVNVFSWILKDDDNDHIYVLPDSIVIPGNGFLVISKDMEAFHSVYNHEPNITGDVPYGFGQGDQVRVYSAIMMLVDSVQYESNDPWPSFSNNFGPSLELINFEDNLLPQNWSASVNIGGTPGLLNSSLNLNILREPFLVPSKIKVSQNYPNPFNPTTTIFYSLLGDDFVNVTIYDLVGRIVKVLVNSKQSAGNKFVIWNATNEKNEPVSSGVYFFNVRVGQYSQTKKMMVIK